MIIIDFECDSLDDDDDLTQEKASLRKSGGHSGQSAEKALYSTPKFWKNVYDDDDDDDDDNDDDEGDDDDDDNDDDDEGDNDDDDEGDEETWVLGNVSGSASTRAIISQRMIPRLETIIMIISQRLQISVDLQMMWKCEQISQGGIDLFAITTFHRWVYLNISAVWS